MKRKKRPAARAPRSPAPPHPGPPQAWQLVEKRVLPSTILIRDRNDLTGRFFLSLALAFNDLKGLILFDQYLAAMGQPAAVDYSPHFGQWHGVRVQIERWITGVLHELMNVIGARQFRTVVQGELLRRLVGTLAPKPRQAWERLVQVADAPMNQPGMTRLLHRIRNSAGFHYNHNGRDLADAYLDLFGRVAVETPHDGNAGMQFSLGTDMDGTRFYFADAAAQQLMHSQLNANQHTMEELIEHAADMNEALVVLLARFIELREAEQQGT